MLSFAGDDRMSCDGDDGGGDTASLPTSIWIIYI